MLAILAAALLAATPAHDTVFTADGGRVLGKVVEEGPQGVSMQLPDGTFRRLARREVVRIEYADGTVSKPAEPAPAPPAYAPPPAQPAPPPAYAPPAYTPPPPPAYLPPPYPVRPVRPPPPAYAAPRAPGPLAPLYLSFSLGGAGFAGEAERDVDIDRVAANQFALGLEGGIRLNPHLAVGLYLDGGVGDAGSDFRSDPCDLNGLDCTASTTRFGALFRATLEPAASSTPWVSAGTGWESTTVSFNDGGPDLTYSGWDMLRLQGGWDFRGHGVVGIGLYAGVRVGRYGKVEAFDPDLGRVTTVHLGGDRTTHTTIEAGVRFTLFP